MQVKLALFYEISGCAVNWENLRVVKHIAELGTVRSAAAALSVNPSTVMRRLDQLESELGAQLFHRDANGLVPTQLADQIMPMLNQVGLQLKDIETALKGQDDRLEGKVRLAVPDVFAVAFMLEDLADFTHQHPQIDLEIVPGYQNLNISRGEVDVAIRATENPPEDLVGRELGKVALGAYATPAIKEAHHDGQDYPWVDWASSGEVMSLYGQLRQTYFPHAHIHIRCDQIQMHQISVRCGLGAGILPCFLADQDPGLARLENMPKQVGPTLWLLHHPNLRSLGRVQVLLTAIREIFQRRMELNLPL